MTRRQARFLRQKWLDKWFLTLPPICKLVVEYLRGHCDAAGIWEFNEDNKVRIEAAIGLYKQADVWVHPGLIGIQYATHDIGADDAEERGLDPKKVRLKERVKWSKIVTDINFIPADYDGPKNPKLEIAGEGRWWFLRHIEERYGLWDKKEERMELELVEKETRRDTNVVAILREHGLIDRLRHHFPAAVVKQIGDSITPKPNPAGPSLKDICDAPEGSHLPLPQRRLFWVHYNETHWQNCPDWRVALAEEALRWTLRQEWVNLNDAMPWPESPLECQVHLSHIHSKIMAENGNRVRIGGELRLPPEAQARMRIYLRTKDMIEEQIKRQK